MSRPAPYPADTRAKGWRFELDYEKIDQSDTWSRAEEIPLAQHCLVFMWLKAWSQVPCGSFPNDPDIIRSKCRIPAKVWPQVREVLMRGWWLADDGRLYHDTITARVMAMLGKRANDAGRAAERRARQTAASPKNPPEAAPESHVTPTGVGHEFDTKHQAPSSPAEKKRAPRKRAASPLVERPADVDPQVWSDWTALRAKKRTTVSETAVAGAREEAHKAGMTLEAFLRVWCRRGSQGLEAAWLKPEERAGAATGETNYQRSQRETVAQFTGGLVSRKAPSAALPVMETIDANPVAARLG